MTTIQRLRFVSKRSQIDSERLYRGGNGSVYRFTTYY